MEYVSAINFNQPSKGRLTSEETALTVVNDGNGHGVFGESIGNGAGIWGISHGNQRAIVGSAVKSDGVFGVSEGDGQGVIGESKGNGAGIWGISHGTQNAVVGVADKAAGVFGESKGDGVGIYGRGIRAARFEGIVEVTEDVRLVGADCAEEFDLSSHTETVEPGTVMVFDHLGNLEQSHQSYDKKVAGVVSGAGNYKPALILDKKENSQTKNRLPIALMGKVYCKVDARNSSIESGDLLTTSSTLGHAMKAVDPLKAFGAIIGKALRPLNDGQGMIPVLVALQ
jgi:hypothetical protein